MARTKASKRKKRPPQEGYKWEKGGRTQVIDPEHPMWKDDSSSSEDDNEIRRITAHTSNKNRREGSEQERDSSNKRLKTVSPDMREKVREWSNGIKVDMTCKEFGLHLLGIGWEVIDSKDYLVGAVEAMCECLGIQVGMPKVIVEVQKPTQQTNPKALKVFDVPGKSGWDSNAYYTSKEDGETSLSATAASSAKCRDVCRIQDAVKICGSISHASVAIHDYVTRVEPWIGVNLGVVRHPEEHAAASSDVLRQIKNFLHSPRVHQRNTNDAISLQKTLFSVIVPPKPTIDTSNDDMRRHNTAMRQIISELDLTGAMRQRVLEASSENRNLLDCDPEVLMETKLIRIHRRKEHSNRFVTPANLESFKEYLLTCEVTVDSPNRNDCVHAKDWKGNRIRDEKCGFVLARNRYYQRGLGWLYKHATKPVDEGGLDAFRNSDGDVCVSQTTMERMMPHNYKRLTNTLKSSCRCANCLDAEYLHEDLMSWRNKHLKDLGWVVKQGQDWLETNIQLVNTPEYSLKRQQWDDSKLALDEFKNDTFDVLPDGTLRHKVRSMEEALDLMTCGKVGPSSVSEEVTGASKFHPYHCCLGRCAECPNLPVNRGESYNLIDMILWRIHEHRNWCKLHGALEKGTCAECLSLPAENRPRDKPRKTYDPVKKTASIGKFLADSYAKFNVVVFRQHCFLRRALGKNWCKSLRDPYIILLLVGHAMDVFSGWDFADRMVCEYNNATMTEGMGGSAKNIGMEGCCYHLFEVVLKKVQRHWFGFLSDEKQQDARICFVNRCKFIEEMKKVGKLTEGSTLWLQTDGCGKQYKCHNFMQMHILLAKMYKIRIDVMITTPGHGKCIVDSMAGIDKHLLDHGRISEMDPARMDEHNQAKSEAYKACVFLQHVDRMLGTYKHSRQTEDRYEVKSRKYCVTNYDCTKSEIKARSIPFQNTNFGAVSGWDTGTKNGIKEMYHFRFDYRGAGNTAMARRIPCACSHCTETLDKPWIGLDRNPEIVGTQTDPERVHPRDQPSYQQPKKCLFRSVMMDGDNDLNKWHFVEIAPMGAKCDDEELDEFYTTAMAKRMSEVETEVQVGNIGALSAATDKKEHGFHLVEWTKKAHTLQTASKVYGTKGKVAAGQVVCEGVFWTRVDHSDDWYEPQENRPGKRPKTLLFLLSQVLCGKVCFKKYIAGLIVPPTTARISRHNMHHKSRLIRLGAEEIDFLQKEQIQREGFELSALDKIIKSSSNPSNNKDNEEEQNEEEEYIDDTWENTD